MFKNQQFQTILANLAALSLRQKVGLGVLGVTLMAGMLAFSYLLGAPANSAVYTDIPREELNRMSRILSENGMGFSLDLDRGSISVAPQNIESARLVLADHGLPSNSEAGYELFDKVNSLGLTSFMQEVTKTRATEGELSRTIEMIDGIRMARVHLVLPGERGFGARQSDKPTASVVISAAGAVSPETATAIRHLVAGGVRGLDTDNVTVLRSDGTLISSSDDKIGAGSLRLSELEGRYEQELADKINSALGAHLGEENYRVSVTAKLNSDQRRTDETIFFPESRVERSIRVVRENGSTENSASSEPVSVSENLPEETPAVTTGQSVTENNEKRDEVTNYEISQKRVSTVSDGYQIDKLAIALVVNRSRLAELLPEGADQAAFDAKIAELQQTVRAAVGYAQTRGDIVEVSALEFLPQQSAAEAASAGMARQFLSRQFSTIVNALTAIGGALILAFLVVRPILAYLSVERPGAAGQLPAGGGLEPSGETARQLAPAMGAAAAYEAVEDHSRFGDQLAGYVDQSAERTAFVIRDWLSSGAGSGR